MHPTHTPPATAEPTPADILRGAATYLTTHGWHQGDAFRRDTGQPFPPACTLGAIHVAATGTTGSLNSSTDIFVLRHTEQVLAAYLELGLDLIDTDSFELIADWNDESDRTTEQVTAALNDAADDWDRIHGGAR